MPSTPNIVLFHDGTWKGDAMRQALQDAQLSFKEEPTGKPETAVVVQDGNCYYCPDTVRSNLIPKLQGNSYG